MSESDPSEEPAKGARHLGGVLLTTTRIGILRATANREYLIGVFIFLALFLTLTSLKMILIDDRRGDTAVFFQLVENVANRGAPVSQVFANTQGFIESGLLTMPAEQIARNPLAPPSLAERNMLHFHAYLILYPIAVFARFLPVELVICSLYILTFVGMVALAYFILRSKAVSIAGACLFCLLVVSHPAWSLGLLGQFYPDRLFVLAGFVFMYLVSRNETSRVSLSRCGDRLCSHQRAGFGGRRRLLIILRRPLLAKGRFGSLLQAWAGLRAAASWHHHS